MKKIGIISMAIMVTTMVQADIYSFILFHMGIKFK